MTKVWDPFWISAFQTEFVPQLNAIVDALEKRLLPNLEEKKIELESNRITEEDWERFMSMPATGNEDPADFADRAQNAGIAHYTLMYGIRQGMFNLFAAALYQCVRATSHVISPEKCLGSGRGKRSQKVQTIGVSMSIKEVWH